MKAAAVLLTIVTQSVGLISFSDHVQDHMVLQQAPQKSSVYGTLNTTGSNAAPTVRATVMKVGGSSYDVQGRVDGGNWVAYLEPTTAGGNYSIAVTCDGCTTDGPNTITISDVTFGDVWYCAGQSNMELPLIHTISRNDSLRAIESGQFNNLRVHQIGVHWINWSTVLNVSTHNITSKKTGQMTDIPALFMYSSTCYYFGQELTRMMGEDAPPIGLVHTAVGGSTAAEWTSNRTSSECSNVTLKANSQTLFDSNVVPFSQMTLKGFVWYQGENDMGNVFGNSEYSTGYSCEVPKMLAEWRSLFSQEPNTTRPDAPFGLVTLAPSGTEGHPDIGGMYVAQTASYGDLPNAVFPNTFYAHAFDLGDPFANTTCNGCCPGHLSPGKFCDGCELFCESTNKTAFFMGPIHPRDKLPVGKRLAQACYGTVYEPGKVAVKGPIISGCSVSGGKLTVNFNKQLLGTDTVVVDDYQRHNNASFLQVLTNSTLFRLQTAANKTTRVTTCLDDGTGKSVVHDGVSDATYQSLTTWPMVNIDVEGPHSVTADVSSFGEIFGIRYGFFNRGYSSCCGLNDPTSDPCPLASCPLKSSSGLPATPFMARVVDGKCQCVSPQVCDD